MRLLNHRNCKVFPQVSIQYPALSRTITNTRWGHLQLGSVTSQKPPGMEIWLPLWATCSSTAPCSWWNCEIQPGPPKWEAVATPHCILCYGGEIFDFTLFVSLCWVAVATSSSPLPSLGKPSSVQLSEGVHPAASWTDGSSIGPCHFPHISLDLGRETKAGHNPGTAFPPPSSLE